MKTRWERRHAQGRIELARDRLEIYRLDEAGRLLSWVRDGRSYRRGLDGTVLQIRRYEEGPDKFHLVRRLAPAERSLRLDQAKSRLHEAGEETRDWEADADRFRELYGRVGILPPDQYASLVLQLTQGCSYNRCAFCNFYRSERFAVKEGAAFQEHLTAVLAYFGAGLTARRGTFLGEANAANLPTPALLEALATVRAAFPARHPQRLDQVGAFMDTFSTRRSQAEWNELAAAGLHEIYLGVESGSRTVLKLLQKPGDPQRMEHLVEQLKGAGIVVNLIFLCGAGGHELSWEHVAATTGLLKRLPLGPGDRVYLSDLEVHPESQYARLGLSPLDRWECRQQARAMRALLDYPPPPRGPAVTLYDVRQFVY